MKLNIKSYSIFFQRATTVSSHLQPTIFTINKQRENILLEIPIPVNFIFFSLIPRVSRSKYRYGIQRRSLLSVLAGKIRCATISLIQVYQVDRDNLMKGQCDTLPTACPLCLSRMVLLKYSKYQQVVDFADHSLPGYLAHLWPGSCVWGTRMPVGI